MQKIVSQLVNRELALEDKVKAQLENKFKTLDLDLILANPVAELTDFGLNMVEEVFMKNAMESVLIGVEFSDAVNKSKKDLVIEDVSNS